MYETMYINIKKQTER